MTEDQASADTDGALAPSTQRRAVRERYGSIASDEDSCCGTADPPAGDADRIDMAECGYDTDEVAAVDAGAELGLGCGNPTTIAALDPGETVLDLGSGGGFDCFLAAREVGPEGRVIGVDMTPEMVETARENREANDADTVEFRLGEIEHLPVADGVVDTIISNCVVNLSPSKPLVFREAYRVLRSGGHLAISDVVLTADLPSDVRADPASVASCIAGAASIPDLERMLADAGFVDVAIEPDDDSDSFIRDWDPERDLSEYVVAATITAEKPADA